MKSPTNEGSKTAARLLLTLSWIFVCAGIVAAPLFAASSRPLASGVLYLAFSQVCHQIPDRSFFLKGHPLAVCHRCTGIYFGLLLGSVIAGKPFSLLISARWRRWWVIAATIPLILDALGPPSGIWANTAVSRSATGVLFGIMVASLLYPAAAELFGSSTLWIVGPSRVHGGSS